MNSNTFRMPAVLLAAAMPLALFAAAPAYATGNPGGSAGGGAEGKAGAVVLRAGLDVGLLNKTVQVPLKTSLNEVNAPATAEKTALTVTLDGVEQGKPVSVLRADVASSKATADRTRAAAEVRLVNAKVHVPGLPLLSLIEVEKVTSKAVCEAGRKPVASSNVLGSVTVLGKRTTLSAGGTTKVSVPGVGEVSLVLSGTETTDRTAAAAALRLKVSVNPLKLNVAEVDGEVVLAEARCEAPAVASTPPSTGPEPTPGASTAASAAEPVDSAKSDMKPQTSGTQANLAETGGSSMTPYVAGGALILLGVGGGALVLARGRGRNQA
ncbi:SCO1860 family LAETG-anchored protein [Streptomyces sp. NPDC002054]|uniref:SCO1860 family LAETG-anchored protein n=1 Tax=Streptomyces sp. NPDC002054 TaxID=3154663 RepID=UPI00332B8FA8